MKNSKTEINRRSFLKVSAMTGGGLMLSFSWLNVAGCSPDPKNAIAQDDAIFEPQMVEELEKVTLNAFLSIDKNGNVTIQSPNPEIGQNVKTSMPMIVAEELEVDWNSVRVVQAPLNTEHYTRQVAGGSQSIRQGWKSLRTAGATAKTLLIVAAANKWKVEPEKCTAENGAVYCVGKEKLTYGELVEDASTLDVPKNIKLKRPEEFKIISQSKKNVDLEAIIAGKPLFGLDFYMEGMVYAAILRPPAFGLTIETVDNTKALLVPGVMDTLQFGDKVAVIGKHSWAVLQGKKELEVQWKAKGTLESTDQHVAKMKALLAKKNNTPKRNDGNPERAFSDAEEVVERYFEAPFLPHNCMEPMNFFANVTKESVFLHGPIQTPARTRGAVAKLLGRKESEITLEMSRMGGGFGRRLYNDFVMEAVEVSNRAGLPVQLMYSREDDMTAGIYRPATQYRFKAALKDGKITGYHLTGAGVNLRNSTRHNNFPAAALKHYRVDSHRLDSAITTGAWRAPITNFLACAEQSFLDEVAEKLGQDPVEMRLNMLEDAINKPTGFLDYDPIKFKGVIELAAKKSNWNARSKEAYLGFSAYYSHNTYVAEVAEVTVENNQPKINKVLCAIDCGIVINPDAALNQVQGGVIDGIGHAMYGDFSFLNGKPQADNFDQYPMIRITQIPKVEVHFVPSTNDPTGLGEPSLPPAGGAVANALYKATGRRLYKQPFAKEFVVKS